MLSYLLLAGWGSGLMVPIMVMLVFGRKLDWDKQLEGPTWDFTRSWASNMTAAGTILGYSVLLSCVAPTATLHFLPRQGYLAIGTIAGGLSVLAPLAFNVLSRILVAFRKRSASSTAFLVSAGITMWGLALQLLIGACLVWELYIAKTLPLWTAIGLVAFVLLLCFSVVWYAVLTAADTLAKQVTPVMGAEKAMEADLQVTKPVAWTLL
jgi:hypothetical protein